MEHIAAVLFLIGCSGDFAECRELPAPVTIFETAQECTEQLPFALSAAASQETKIMAKCIAVDPAMEEEDAELVWDVLPDGTLVASVELPTVTVASNSLRNNESGAVQE